MNDSKDLCNLIEEYIKEFEARGLQLDHLISNLQIVLDNVSEVKKEWEDAFHSEWWTLEQVYAVALNRGETYLSVESRNLVHEAIQNMKLLLQEVNSPKQENSSSISRILLIQVC